MSIRVHGPNLAKTATEILRNDSPSPDDIELIRDGHRRGLTFYNRASNGEPNINWYGYSWDTAQTIATLVYNPGLPEEWGGWLTSLEVQYRDKDGHWQLANIHSIEPSMNFENTQWLKGAYIDHSIRITPVTTTGIRIIGSAGGIEQDERNGGERRFYSAISELAVFQE